MLQSYKMIGALVAASAIVAGSAKAEVEYEISAGYASEYLWRGTILGQDLTEFGLNVSTEYSGFTFTGGAWYGVFDKGQVWNPTTLAYDQTEDLDELDLFIEVSKDLSFVDLAVGYVYYENEGWLPAGENRDLGEVYVRASKEVAGVDLALSYYWDVEGENGGYTELKASKSWEVYEATTLNAGLSTAYLAEEDDVVYVAASVSVDYELTETATISPYVIYSIGTGSSAGLNYDNEIVGGARLTLNF